MGKFWEDQWSQMEGWATPAKYVRAMNNNMPLKSRSTSASESSFTVSTQDSPSLSAQSEASSIAGKYMLQSPDLSEARFRRIALFNPDTKHSRSLSMGSAKGELTKTEKQQYRMLLQDGGLLFENIHLASDLDASATLDIQIEPFVTANERLVQSAFDLVHCTQSLSDKSWLSDGTESWASASSQELPWNHSCDGADDLHPSILQETSRYCPTEDRSTFYDDVVSIRRGDRVCGANKANEDANKKPTHLKSRHSVAVDDKFLSSSLNGYFRFVEQDGSPCYSFSVNDSDEVFFARACKPESQSNNEDSNCLYTFHSRKDDGGKAKGGWKSWLKKEKLASSLVGKMKVFDSRCIDRDRNRTKESKCVEETHFVLYGERCLDQMSAQHPSKLLTPDSASKSKFSSMPTLGSHSQNLKHRGDDNASQGLIRAHLSEPISKENMSEWGSDDFEAVKVAHCLKHSTAEHNRTNMELAVIAITTSVKEHKVTRKKAYDPSLKERAGWGATFLEKGSEKGWGLGFLKSSEIRSKLKPSLPLEEDGLQPPVLLEEDRRRQQVNEDTCESDTKKLRHHTDSAQTNPKPCHIVNEKLTQKLTSSEHKEPKMVVDVVVILPAGHHGVPRIGPSKDDGSYGPTPLLERWKSGGNCDCGGWDMGCGLSVLKAETLKLHEKRATMALTSRDRINWISPGKPLKIFTQGYKRKKLLMLEIIQAGLLSLSFQARFSPLQAFATAVAIFHQQITHE